LRFGISDFGFGFLKLDPESLILIYFKSQKSKVKGLYKFEIPNLKSEIELYHAFFYQRLQADSNKENFFCGKTTVFP